MLLNKVLLETITKKQPSIIKYSIAGYCTKGGDWHDERRPIGKREWVGYGLYSSPNYFDRIDCPMPAVRFKEITGDLVNTQPACPAILHFLVEESSKVVLLFLYPDEIFKGLKEKEKGDWKNLTIEEKKKLYRASFRQTFAEVNAPTGEWKSTLGFLLIFSSLGIWLYMASYKYLLPSLPSTFSEEHREKMFRHMLVNKYGHLSGVSSKWDYEKDDWK